jgi:hypothetical protein
MILSLWVCRRLKILSLAGAVVIMGCASSSETRRGSLSEAFNKASEDSPSNRKVADSQQNDRSHNRDQDHHSSHEHHKSEHHDNDEGESCLFSIFKAIAWLCSNASESSSNESHEHATPSPPPRPRYTPVASNARPSIITTASKSPDTASSILPVATSSKTPDTVSSKSPVTSSVKSPAETVKLTPAQPIGPDVLRVNNRYFGLSYSHGINNAWHDAEFDGLSLHWTWEFYNGRYHSLEVGGRYAQIGVGHELFGSIDDFTDGIIAYTYRYSCTPQYTAASIFLLVGFGIDYLHWEYKNAISSDVYNENGQYLRTDVISSDGLVGISPSVGIGVALNLLPTIKPIVYVRGGVNLYNDKTTRSFNNDLFRGGGFIQAEVKMDFRM